MATANRIAIVSESNVEFEAQIETLACLLLIQRLNCSLISLHDN